MTIAVVGASVLAWTWSGDPASDTLRYELAKTSMQVIAVAAFGGLASIATFAFQDRRAQAAKDRERRAVETQRDVDRLRDERTRLDDLLRSTLQATLTSYHQVKRARRLLVADTRKADGAHVTIDVYDKHMACILDQQLEFEQFKKLAFLIDELPRRPSGDQTATPAERATLRRSYKRIEKYLNKVIKEYKEKRHLVAGGSGVPLEELTTLSAFLGSAFKPAVADRMDDIIKVLQTALLQPLDLSQLTETDTAAAPRPRTPT
ncbi:MAG TPA: hypothetical protein VFJ14_13155 [Nocardioidaceae bacterium]|nr:hypothetical protein [Nocardioidaceae bacterium]